MGVRNENISARLFYCCFHLYFRAALVQNGVRMLFLLLHYSLLLQQEVILARIEQILASRSLTEDEYAQLLYERGVLHDSLGFRALARK